MGIKLNFGAVSAKREPPGVQGAGAPGRSLEQNMSENVPTNGIHGSEGFSRNVVKMSLPMAFTALRDFEIVFQFVPNNEPKE